jgi:hypothetical protein
MKPKEAIKNRQPRGNPETQAKLGTRHEDKQNEKHNTENLKAITLIKPEPLYEQLPEHTLK